MTAAFTLLAAVGLVCFVANIRRHARRYRAAWRIRNTEWGGQTRRRTRTEIWVNVGAACLLVACILALAA